MFLTPLNYSFPLQLVPIFEWEPVQPADGAATPAPPPAPCEGTDASMAPADTPSSPPDLRLVFKGYEWRAVAERAVFYREDWESVFRGEADAKEEERDPSAHHSEPAHHQRRRGPRTLSRTTSTALTQRKTRLIRRSPPDTGTDPSWEAPHWRARPPMSTLIPRYRDSR